MDEDREREESEGGQIPAKGRPEYAHPVREAAIVALLARQYGIASVGQLEGLGLA